MAPQEPDLGSKYEVRHQIGKGSFGSAFLVTNKQDKKDYVLKRVRLAKQTKWQRNSTLQERDLVSMLQHPFIVPCVETWMVQAHTVNMIYGYCEKGDLATYLQKVVRMRGQVEEQQMMTWLCQLLLALDYLQTMKVLHRDIKTSNLMLTCDMDVQLGDFGLATLMQDAGDDSRPEDTNLVGTPHYMSPELLSCQHYGFKTDVWSLGCVFYELTAQRPTFNAFNIHGLVSKIKKNKLAPLPDSYSSEWKEVVGLMLCKNPDRRPSVQELMALPFLRPTLLKVRARALALMPTVQLPPLLDPTPLVLGSRRGTADEQGADSDGSLCGTLKARSSRDCLDAEEADGAGSSEAWSTDMQAVDQSELSELWRLNSMQQEHHKAAAAAASAAQQRSPQQAEQLLEQQQAEQGQSDSDSHLVDTHSRCSMSSYASSSIQAGALRPHSPAATGPGMLEKRNPHVHQPGIKKTSAERVAAAIAAARAAKADTHDDQAPAAAADDATTAAPADTGSSTSTTTSPRRAGLCYRLSSFKEDKAAAASKKADPDSSRAPSARLGSSRSSSVTPRPAWNAGGGSNAAGNLARQRSTNSRTITASTLKAAAAALTSKPAAGDAGKAAAAGATEAHGIPASSHYLQSLEDHAQQHKQQQGSGADSVQHLLDKSQELSRKTVQLQQGLQQQQEQHRALNGHAPDVQSRHQQLQHPTPVRVARHYNHDSDDSDEDDDPDSAVKQLQFDSSSPAIGRHLSETTTPLAASGPTPRASTPFAATPSTSGPPDMFAAATRGVSAAVAVCKDESPVLWGNAPAAAAALSQPDVVAAENSDAAEVEQEATLRRGISAATGSLSQPAAAVDAVAGSPGYECDSESLASEGLAAERARRSSSSCASSAKSTGQKRLELLESVVRMLGGLYASGRWQEMGSVFGSPGLLPDSMYPALHAAMLAGPPTEQPFSPAARGRKPGSPAAANSSSSTSGGSSSPFSKRSRSAQSTPGSARAAGVRQTLGGGAGRVLGGYSSAASGVQQQEQQQTVLRLGDIVVLGKSKRVKGKIRFIGPVAWDPTGEDWVGMELDSPVGTNGTQRGITYFTCPPNHASFHRASKLSSV